MEDSISSDEFKLIKKRTGISDNDKKIFTKAVRANDPNLKISPTGITYKGRRVILCIRDKVQYVDKNSEYKFHLIYCKTLKAIHNWNRYGKYGVSTSTTGKFKVSRILNNKLVSRKEKLHVCKHCLQNLNWKGYNSADEVGKKFIYEHFSIEEFFAVMGDDNSENFHELPTDNDLTARPNVYPSKWHEIACRLKEKYNYTCQECHKNFSDCKFKLHVHHKNGLKWDCRESNLEVLCRECHHKKHNQKIDGG